MLGLIVALSYGHAVVQSSTTAMKDVVVMPGVKMSIPASAKLAIGKLPATASGGVWAYADGRVAYSITIIGPSAKPEKTDSADIALAEFLGGLEDTIDNPVLKRQRDLCVNGWPGIEALILGNAKPVGGFAIWTKAYAVANSIYALGVSYATESGRPPSAEAFLNSLSVESAKVKGPLDVPGPLFATFTPSGAGFSIGMPSAPKEQELPIGAASKKNFIHRFTSRYGNRAYIANFLAFPSDAPELTQGQKNEGLATLVDNVVTGLEAKVTSQAATSKRNGIEFVTVECARPDGMVGRIEATVAERRIFVTIMVYPSGHAGSPDIDAFFNSFKLLPPEPKSK